MRASGGGGPPPPMDGAPTNVYSVSPTQLPFFLWAPLEWRGGGRPPPCPQISDPKDFLQRFVHNRWEMWPQVSKTLSDVLDAGRTKWQIVSCGCKPYFRTNDMGGMDWNPPLKFWGKCLSKVSLGFRRFRCDCEFGYSSFAGQTIAHPFNVSFDPKIRWVYVHSLNVDPMQSQKTTVLRWAKVPDMVSFWSKTAIEMWFSTFLMICSQF